MLIIGLGNRMRRDDAAGLEVIRRLAGRLPQGSLAECSGDASELISLWQGQASVVVIDASLSGRPVGTISRHNALDLSFSDRGMAASSHALSLKEAIALGKALDTLPKQLRVAAIEGESFAFGDEMSPLVAASVDQLADELVVQFAERQR